MKRLIFALMALAIIVSACSSPSKLDVKKSQIMGKMLEVNNVPYSAISSKGSSVEVYYETSSANGYDAQIVVDWGYIFATAGMMNYSEISIVNKVNGEPYARMTTTGDNVFALSQGYENESTFWEGVEIESVN